VLPTGVASGESGFSASAATHFPPRMFFYFARRGPGALADGQWCGAVDRTQAPSGARVTALEKTAIVFAACFRWNCEGHVSAAARAFFKYAQLAAESGDARGGQPNVGVAHAGRITDVLRACLPRALLVFRS